MSAVETATGRRLKLGVVGLGRALTLMLPTFLADRRIELVAAADPRAEATRRFASEFGARTYASVEELCGDPAVEVVYIATPHQYHASHVIVAAANGKHALVEKPMTITLEDCARMIEAAERARVQLIIGHSHSFDRPIQRVREIVASGAVGELRLINAQYYTDFLFRLRRTEELDTRQGGGAVFNQAAHQLDIVRLLGGGRVRSVRALTGAWDAARPTEGAYAALLTFENGAIASILYSGYAHFDSDELCGAIGELGWPKDASAYGAARRNLRRAAIDELALKNARNYGGAEFSSAGSSTAVNDAAWHQHFGFVLVSCDRADLRPLPTGVMIYGDDEARLEPLSRPAVPRVEVIDELYGAVALGRPPLHDGRWAMATVEACLAILESAREGRDITLRHQVGLPL
jgi:phthalate 4,5-cis-dihydrodiol dehydrogenase